MKKIVSVIGAIAAFGLVGSANAADMPAKAVYKAPVAQIYNWSGWYAGLNAGGAWGRSDPSLTIGNSISFFAPTSVAPVQNALGGLGTNPTAFTGGGQIGYNWQFSPNAVFGIETDFNSFRLRGSATNTSIYPVFLSPFTQTRSVSTDWLWTLRPRLGWASNNWLLYVTGGLAVTNIKTAYTFSDTTFLGFVNSSGNHTKAGWVVGGGVEWAPWMNNWTVKAEYLYLNFGSVSDSAPMTGAGTVAPVSVFNYSTKLTASIARLGINYKF